MSDIDFGRKLTKDEIIECIAATGDDYCAACGDKWEDHHLMCEGSYIKNSQPSADY